MKYFIKLSKHIYHIQRNMSSFKLLLWENSMFVNCSIPMGETEQKIIVILQSPFNKLKKINLCRSPEDTIRVFIDRLALKLSQTQPKSENEKLRKDCVCIKVNGIKVPNNSKCYEIFEEIKENITLQIKDHTFKGYNVSFMKTQYLWYRINSNDEIEVGNEMTYTPSAEDVNCHLKLVCRPFNDAGQSGPSAEITTSPVLENTITLFPFEKRLKTKPHDSIRVVTYNILAGEYTKTKEAKNAMFPYCPEDILSSSYRHPLIIREILAYNGDIICLQEVDRYFFHRELCPILKQFKGMTGLFLKKNSRRNEGLSCFYSPDKFNLLEKFDISFNDPTTIGLYCGPVLEWIKDNDIWKEGLETKTVFQVLVLELISDKKQLFLVCNTHLISDPEGDFLRLFQALIELTIINKIKQNISKEYLGRNVSVIFCGDFNSTPESGVYDLVTKLLLSEEYKMMKVYSDLKNNLEFEMESAYDIDVLYSNYTATFVGLLDYIYFTNQHLERIQVLTMPSHDDVIQFGGIPSKLFPSDHLALVADFKIK
ncbi:2',5'-phosphodiesterase 12 isoform X2 [Myzus persicae]|uniref:2',5'-phosphodiesterase 12 isoform X2 n=1 Tax=Myzus persicae TaxID=13164 RepID=UPI000B938909|nr:2',5'-phosphodiesterase 12 isoform X2 [Myzus persicae]